jgi:ribosome biogenesis protein ENP2
VKIFETSNLGLKCERGVDSEIIDFQILGDDYEKLAFLEAD